LQTIYIKFSVGMDVSTLNKYKVICIYGPEVDKSLKYVQRQLTLMREQFVQISKNELQIVCVLRYI